MTLQDVLQYLCSLKATKESQRHKRKSPIKTGSQGIAEQVLSVWALSQMLALLF